MRTEKLEQVDINLLVPYVNNARRHSPEQVNQLRASLREFGFVNPILIDDNYNIIAGHGRLMAAQAEGLEKVPCVFVEHLTDAQKRAYILADNRLAELGDWDEELLRLELDALKNLDFDIALTGFDDYKFTAEEIADDNFDVAAELDKPVVAKLGDVWTLGRHKIICGDSTDPATYQKLLRGEKVQLVLTDPPYFVDLDSTSGKILNDNLTDADGLKFLHSTFKNFYDATTNDASFYIFYATSKTRIFFDAFEDTGFKILAGLVWKKDQLVLSRGDFKFNHEPVIYGMKKTGTHHWYGDQKQTTVFEFPRIKNSATEGFGHPSSKPVPLIAYLMQLSSKAGDKVLDGFLGSGSTLIAAEQLNRTCLGIELEPKFVDVVVERFRAASNEKISVERDGQTISC